MATTLTATPRCSHVPVAFTDAIPETYFSASGENDIPRIKTAAAAAAVDFAVKTAVGI